MDLWTGIWEILLFLCKLKHLRLTKDWRSYRIKPAGAASDVVPGRLFKP